MNRVCTVSAFAAALLAGAVLESPDLNAACGKICAGNKPVAAAGKRTVRSSVKTERKSKGNIGDYWSPCNSDKLTDYMYCQP